jgi:hypothetical protein
MFSFKETPFNRALRFEMNRVGPATEVTMPVEEWFMQENGIVHGGMIASLAAVPPRTADGRRARSSIVTGNAREAVKILERETGAGSHLQGAVSAEPDFEYGPRLDVRFVVVFNGNGGVVDDDTGGEIHDPRDAEVQIGF